MTAKYSIKEKREQTRASLNPSIPLQAAALEMLRQFERRGMRYSNEDVDVWSTAHGCVGREEPREFERAWVAAMLRSAEASQ